MAGTELINHFITLLVVANPLSALPAVLRITRNQSIKEKQKTGLTASIAVAIIFMISIWLGTSLLTLLGIRLPAFQIAGGLILLLLSFSMLNAEESSLKANPDEQTPRSAAGAIVPLAIPIIAGPGAISTLIVLVDQTPGFVNQLFLSISSLLVAIVIALLLYFASKLEKILGSAGINIMNRIGGLILAAIAIESLANGLIGMFPILAAGISQS